MCIFATRLTYNVYNCFLIQLLYMAICFRWQSYGWVGRRYPRADADALAWCHSRRLSARRRHQSDGRSTDAGVCRRHTSAKRQVSLPLPDSWYIIRILEPTYIIRYSCCVFIRAGTSFRWTRNFRNAFVSAQTHRRNRLDASADEERQLVGSARVSVSLLRNVDARCPVDTNGRCVGVGNASRPFLVQTGSICMYNWFNTHCHYLSKLQLQFSVLQC